MLKRTDWRALQQSADDASEPIQMELLFGPSWATILSSEKKKENH